MPDTLRALRVRAHTRVCQTEPQNTWGATLGPPRFPMGPQQPGPSSLSCTALVLRRGHPPLHLAKHSSLPLTVPFWGKEGKKQGLGDSRATPPARRGAGQGCALQSPQGTPALQEPRRSSAGALIHSRARCGHRGWGEAAPGTAVQARDSCGPGRWSADRGSPCIRRLWSGLTHGAAGCGAVF